MVTSECGCDFFYKKKVIKAKINFLKNEPKSATKIKQLKAELKPLKRYLLDTLISFILEIESCI